MDTTKTNSNNQPTKPKTLRELIGKITDKTSSKVYIHKRECWFTIKDLPKEAQTKCLPDCHYGQSYYKLKIVCENKPEVKQILAFKSFVATEKIWKEIEETKYHNKTYAFDCSQWMNLFRLVNMRELNT